MADAAPPPIGHTAPSPDKRHDTRTGTVEAVVVVPSSTSATPTPAIAAGRNDRVFPGSDAAINSDYMQQQYRAKPAGSRRLRRYYFRQNRLLDMYREMEAVLSSFPMRHTIRDNVVRRVGGPASPPTAAAGTTASATPIASSSSVETPAAAGRGNLEIVIPASADGTPSVTSKAQHPDTPRPMKQYRKRCGWAVPNRSELNDVNQET